MVQIISFFDRRPKSYVREDWSNQDLAELYRVEAALIQAGFKLASERGSSDEGDPWFAFCHEETGEVIVHFARIDGRYIVASPVLANTLAGPDLETIARQFIVDNPVVLQLPGSSRRDNIAYHPAALLTILVASILIIDMPGEGWALAAAGEEKDTPSDLHQDASAKFSPMALQDEASAQRIGEKGLLLAGVAIALALDVRLQSQHDEKTVNGLAFADGILERTKIDSFKKETLDIDFSDLSNHDFDPEDAHVSDGSVLAAGEEADATQLYVTAKVYDDSPDELTKTTPAASSEAAHVIEEALSASNEEAKGLSQPHLNVTAHAEWLFPPIISSAETSAEIKTNAARDWFEKITSSIDQEVPLLNGVVWEAASQNQGNYDTVEDLLVFTTIIEAQNLEATSSIFDERAKLAISYFITSDDDIIASSQAGGFIILFDQSDLNDSSITLVSHTWSFFDDTQISIVGQAETVADALALIA